MILKLDNKVFEIFILYRIYDNIDKGWRRNQPALFFLYKINIHQFK